MVISEYVGHDMVFSILNTTTTKFISRSNVRPEGEPTSPDLRIDPMTAPKVFTSRHPPYHCLKDNEEAPDVTEDELPDTSTSSPKHKIHVLDPNDLVGRNFVIPQDDGQRLRARIVKAIDDYDRKLQLDSTRLKIMCSTKDDTIEDVFT